jgi:RES domain-containing protein
LHLSDSLGSNLYVTYDLHTQKVCNELKIAIKKKCYTEQEIDSLDFFRYFMEGIQKIDIIPSNCFYRGRLGVFTQEIELCAPPKEKCSAGRLNPKGVPYLYLADSIDTVISELRPSTGSKITIACFKTKQTLRLLDFCRRQPHKGNDYLKIIDDDFSRPVKVGHTDDYCFTQYIAGFIKRKGYDGVKYTSSLNKNGYNITIFDPDKMAIVDFPNKRSVYTIVNNKSYKLSI